MRALWASLYQLVPKLGKASPRLLLASHSISLVGLRPDAALFSDDSAVSACLHLNVSRVVLGLGRASSRLRLAKHKLKCVSTTFCSWKPSPELQKHDFEVLGASFRPQRACPGLPGDSFSSPESLPGAPPESPRSRPEKGGGPQAARHKEKWILAESSS